MLRWRQFARESILSAFVVAVVSVVVTAGVAGMAFAVEVVVPPHEEGAHILAWVFGVIMGLFLFAGAFNRLFVIPVVRQFAAEHLALIEKLGAQHREFITETLTEISQGFDGLMLRHIDSHNPHPIATHEMHGEITSTLRALAEKTASLAKEIEAVDEKRGAEIDEILERCRRLSCTARNPMDSPNKRRGTDPQTGGPNGSGEDFRKERNRALRKIGEIPPEE